MKNVLFTAPTRREYRALPELAEKLGIRLIWDDFAGDYFDDFLEKDAKPENTLDIVELIEKTIEKHKHEHLSGVTTAVGYPGMPAVAVIAERFGLPGPNLDVIMPFQNASAWHSTVLTHSTPLLARTTPPTPHSL